MLFFSTLSFQPTEEMLFFRSFLLAYTIITIMFHTDYVLKPTAANLPRGNQYTNIRIATHQKPKMKIQVFGVIVYIVRFFCGSSSFTYSTKPVEMHIHTLMDIKLNSIYTYIFLSGCFISNISFSEH